MNRTITAVGVCGMITVATLVAPANALPFANDVRHKNLIIPIADGCGFNSIVTCGECAAKNTSFALTMGKDLFIPFVAA